MSKRRTALVTGGTRGIGAAIADRLATDGLDVIVTGRNPPVVNSPNHRFYAVDFEDQQSVLDFLQVIPKLGIDVLVNNAGINKIAAFDQIVPEDFDRIQNVNLRVPFLICQAVLEKMRAQKWGRIVNISSVFGKISKEHRASYSASKFALDGMTAALAAEVAAQGILANCVAPGFIETDLTRSILGESGMAELATRVPMKRLGQPQEIAALVSWLVSGDNTYLTGQNIAIDGGFTRV